MFMKTVEVKVSMRDLQVHIESWSWIMLGTQKEHAELSMQLQEATICFISSSACLSKLDLDRSWLALWYIAFILFLIDSGN